MQYALKRRQRRTCLPCDACAMRAESPTAELHVACLCAAWCRLCEAYVTVFEQAVDALRQNHPGLHVHWLDIEDDAALLGDYDVETFPTLLVADARQVRFAGPLTPQPETLHRVLRAALAEDHAGSPQPPEVLAFAQRLRGRAGG